jgi:3'(2'), 5'-bisphosphate nucleotidase
MAVNLIGYNKSKLLQSFASLRLCGLNCLMYNHSTLNLNTTTLLHQALEAAALACREIMDVYTSGDFQAEAKGDNSPLTAADKRAHEVIASTLQNSGLPILSEEGKMIPFEERRNWEYFWMVDPLDGTKEFLKRNGEFTVNIALIHKNRPVMGVVAVPVTGDVYYTSGDGVLLKRNGIVQKLAYRGRINLKQRALRVVASRSHMTEETQQFVNSLAEPSLVSSGSSLKFMLLAEGAADVYPRYAPTMEWDTAASHAIANAVGLKVTQQGSLDELVYNKENLLNPGFLVS